MSAFLPVQKAKYLGILKCKIRPHLLNEEKEAEGRVRFGLLPGNIPWFFLGIFSIEWLVFA